MTTVSPQPVRTETPKPSYLGLLNAIAVAEGNGHRFLTEWADRSTDPQVETALRTVAAREGEHSYSFARRVVELGYRVRPRPLTDEEKLQIEVAGSEKRDVEKFEALGYADEPATSDIFEGYFKDHSIDPVTGALLGRFVCEERDSGRILRQAYRRLKDLPGA
jgi:hypothetical protein